jgi:hypothetical protein
MGETRGTYEGDEKWAGHVAHMGETRNVDGFCGEM